MANSKLGQRIKELRISKGYSQELLASKTDLNLRTIQRIESGESVPRGDALNRLSEALEVSPDEIIELNKNEDGGFLMLLNLSSFSFIILPILGFLIPLVLWMAKKEEIKKVDECGKQIIIFQISIIVFIFSASLLFYLILMLIFWTIKPEMKDAFLSWLLPFMVVGFPIILYYVYNFITILINTIRASKNMPIKYRPKMNLIK